MAQILTSEGLADFYATGKVPEFIKPEEPKAADKAAELDKPSVAGDAPDAAKAEPKDDDESEDQEGLTAAERKAYSERVARKISAKHKALKQAEAAIGTEAKGRQAAEKQVSDLKAELDALKSAAKGDGSPKAEDFTDSETYWKAVMKWTADEAVKQDRAAQERARVETARQERISQFASTVDDYDEMVDTLKGIPQHQAVIDLLNEADLGPNLVYYFAKHPDEYTKLTRLKPFLAVAEVGKIETKLERKAEKSEKTATADDALDRFKQTPLSKAPAPIQSINESASPLPKDPSKMGFDELRAYNRERRLKQAMN